MSEWQVVEVATASVAAAASAVTLGSAIHHSGGVGWHALGKCHRQCVSSKDPLSPSLRGLQFLQLTVAGSGSPGTPSGSPLGKPSNPASASASAPASTPASLQLDTLEQLATAVIPAAVAPSVAFNGDFTNKADGTTAAVWGLLRVAAAELQGVPVRGTSTDATAAAQGLQPTTDHVTGRPQQGSSSSRKQVPLYADGHGATSRSGFWAAPRLLASRPSGDAASTAGIAATGVSCVAATAYSVAYIHMQLRVLKLSGRINAAPIECQQ